MIQRVILVYLAATLGVVGCGSSDGGDTGGAGSGEGASSEAAVGGAGGEGGLGGEGGAGGEVAPTFTSVMDRIDAGLVYQLEGCQMPKCRRGHLGKRMPSPRELYGLPLSDDQNECIDGVIVGEEERTLENRLACLIEVDLAAADCLAEVSGCEAAGIADCVDARTMQAGSCSTPQESALGSFFECQATVVEDAVDAFLDSRSAQCDCLTNCTSADPDPDVFECMVDTLQAELDMLGPAGPTELTCINEFWRRRAVCFGNEMICDGAITACADLPSMVCGISGAILDDCLAL